MAEFQNSQTPPVENTETSNPAIDEKILSEVEKTLKDNGYSEEDYSFILDSIKDGAVSIEEVKEMLADAGVSNNEEEQEEEKQEEEKQEEQEDV
jgi:hypothetical protein